jgi:hypothetical protein
MRRPAPAPSTPPPPLSWREVVVLLLLLPLWLPILAGVVAALVVVGLLFDPPTEIEPAPDDDGLPDDDVPPFVPPPRDEAPITRLPPPRRISVVPAPASVTSTATTRVRRLKRGELGQAQAGSWSGRFPGG